VAKTKRKTKAEELQEAVAEAVGAGKELHLESVDFSDPNRPKTCLEVDFPILPINHIAAIEGNAGKPIYQMSKWWARRRSSVFRALLIAAATKAPDDPAEAAKLVWDSYYGNHQKNEAFKKLKVADIFMGGGTTIVEGSRLGMQMYGNDLNPVAWLIVKNELAQVDSDEVQTLLNEIEAEVKPQLTPFYACDCPRGHKGKWTHKPTGKTMAGNFDPLCLTPEQRPEYDYQGPEILHAFWAKHGPCQATECNHRTPIMTSPVVAVKRLTIKAWNGKECQSCSKTFDVEQKEARMAPAAMLVVAESETPHAIMNDEGIYSCPHCGQECHDEKAANDGESASLGKSENKKVELTLLVHPDWLKGSPGKDANGNWLGGSVTDEVEATTAWNEERAKTLKLIEVRGKLPDTITCPDTGEVFSTGSDGGTVPRQAHFVCTSATCGLTQTVLSAVESTKQPAPISVYAIQGFCPECSSLMKPYNGKFFACESLEHSTNAATFEWSNRSKTELANYWPKSSIPFGSRTHIKDPLPKHGYSFWWMMYNHRQLLVLSQLLRSIKSAANTSPATADFVLGAFQQYVRNQSMFSFWHLSKDHFAPALSNNNFNPKNRMVEVGVFTPSGYGTWPSTVSSLSSTLSWMEDPWDLLPVSELAEIDETIAATLSSKSVKVYPADRMQPPASIVVQSSTDLKNLSDESLDLVVTDPPFGDLIQYSELSDFFYVWIRLGLKDRFPEFFAKEFTPRTLEAVSNDSRHGKEADEFYSKVLTECWKECERCLKPGGLLAFTFHHSEDEPWLAVLKSLFDAGFFLEATFPIRSDETKGQGEFGSQQIEFDIVHVCRKRLVEPEPISWARLRRQIMRDVRQLQEIIEQHQNEGLGEADLQVIRRGKALEYFSRHYGKVYIEKGREDEFTVKDALVGINQLLDDESDTTTEAPPVLAEPYTRQFLRLFADRESLERDQLQKYLRGTGVSPSEFIDRGWCTETKKIFTVTPPLEWAQEWKGINRKAMSRDFDQSYFLVGACYDESGIRVSDALNSGTFGHHPAIPDLLNWFGKHGSDSEMRDAAKRAKQLYSSWVAKNSDAVTTQQTLFDLDDKD